MGFSVEILPGSLWENLQGSRICECCSPLPRKWRWPVTSGHTASFSPCSLWWKVGAVVETCRVEGAFHGWDREGAQPLSSFLSFIPSISTNRRNLGKFTVVFHAEKMFGSQRFCGNVLGELAQLCGSVLTELPGSFLVLSSKKNIALCHLSSAHPENTNEDLQKWSEDVC